MTVVTKMVVRAVSVMFLSVYLMAGNHLTVSAANGEKISEDSDFSVSGENMDSLLNVSYRITCNNGNQRTLINP